MKLDVGSVDFFTGLRALLLNLLDYYISYLTLRLFNYGSDAGLNWSWKHIDNYCHLILCVVLDSLDLSISYEQDLGFSLAVISAHSRLLTLLADQKGCFEVQCPLHQCA